MCKKYLFYVDKSGNSRNGRTAKRLQSESGSLDLEVPRDRNGSFEPKIVEKRQRRVAGLDDTIVYLYAQGQSTRTIQQTLKRLYGAEVSSTLISEVTSSVLEEVNAWQARPLESVYPIVYFDALFVKSREEGAAKTRAVYVALAIDMQGEKQVLGLWIAPSEETALSALDIGGLEREVCGDRAAVEKGLGKAGAFLRLPSGDPQGGLHDERGRIAELQPSQDRQGQGRFPERRSDLQTAMARPAGSLEEVEATHTGLEGRTQPVRHTLRGPCSY